MDTQCSVCKNKNQQLLMLSCNHDPCIDCAAMHYFSGAQYRKQLKQAEQANYWCQICYEPTIIDRSSIKQLHQYFNKKNNRSKVGTTQITQSLQKSKESRGKLTKFQNKIHYSRNDSDLNNPYLILPNSKNKRSRQYSRSKQLANQRSKELDSLISMVKSQQFKSSNTLSHKQKDKRQKSQSIKNIKFQRASSKDGRDNRCAAPQKYLKYFCQQHEDELQNYYCFTCIKSVCVQCALHGSHFGHQIEAVKKANGKLKIMYEMVINQSQKWRNILESNIKQIQNAIENFITWNSNQKQMVKQKFSQLYQQLNQRQKIILSQIRQIQVSSLKTLNVQKFKYQEVLESVKRSRKQLKKSIAEEPSNWNVQEMQKLKKQLKQAIQIKDLQIQSKKKIESEIQYVQTKLIAEAIDTIQQLVSSFKIERVKNQEIKQNS